MPRDPNAPPPPCGHMKPAMLLEAYRLAAKDAGPNSPLTARYRQLAAELGTDQSPTSGEPNPAPRALPDKSRSVADSGGRAPDMPAHFRRNQ